MRRCDSLPPISPRFVSFAWRYHRCVRCSSPPAPDAEPWINRELVGGISSRLARWKRQGLPSSRRNPCDHSPYSSDPGVTRQAEWTMSKLPGAAPATDHDEGSPRVVISGLNRTAFDLAVYASQGWSPTHHARLASGCWSGSTGRDWLPAGFHLKGFKLPTILLSRAFLARGQTEFQVNLKLGLTSHACIQSPGHSQDGPSNHAPTRSVCTAAAVASLSARFSHSCGINVSLASLGRYARTCERYHGLFSPGSRPTASSQTLSASPTGMRARWACGLMVLGATKC